MKYQVEENCLTIFLPGELDHHNAEERMKKILTMSGVTKIIQMYEEETI